MVMTIWEVSHVPKPMTDTQTAGFLSVRQCAELLSSTPPTILS